MCHSTVLCKQMTTFISRNSSPNSHTTIDVYSKSWFFSESGHECKTVALRDTVPNKPKYCNWPEGVPLWLIGGVPAHWNQFHVPLASCKPRLDLCSDGEVFLTHGKILLLAVSAFLTGDKLKLKGVIYWTNLSIQFVIKMLEVMLCVVDHEFVRFYSFV